MATCALCTEQVPDTDVVDHIRVIHPAAYEPVQTWPDGRRVVTDETLQPGDFTATGDGQPAVKLGKHEDEGATVADDLPRRSDGTLKPASPWLLIVVVFAGLALIGSYAWLRMSG